jgi:fructose-1,6-bisphosphatase I
MNRGVTVTEHILFDQAQSPTATGSFTRLLNAIVVAAKVVQREVSKAGLVDILGYAGRTNVQGEQVRKLDDFANDTMIRRLTACGEVCAMASEEDADLVEMPRGGQTGNYVVIFDRWTAVPISTPTSALERFFPFSGASPKAAVKEPWKMFCNPE